MPALILPRFVLPVLAALVAGIPQARSAPGDLDTSLAGGTGVVVVPGSTGSLRSVAIQTDGKILASGYLWNSNEYREEFAVARVTAAGVPDTGFNGTGFTVFPVRNAPAIASALLVQPDGKILLGGVTWEGDMFDEELRVVVARLEPGGTLDTNFGTGGILDTGIVAGGGATFEQFDAAKVQLALQADGKIVVAFRNEGDFEVVRCLANGTPDNTFSGDGHATVSFSATGKDTPYGLTVLANGSVVVVGDTDNVNEIAIARFQSNGTLDPAFSGDGKNTVSVPDSDYAYLGGSVVQPDGRILITGWLQPVTGSDKAFLMRLTADGALDNTFNGTGLRVTSVAGVSVYGDTLTLQSDGAIVVAGQGYGTGPNQTFLARYLPAGTLDSSFGSGGTVLTPGYIANAVAVQNDGKIVTVGDYSASAFETNLALARYHGSAASPLQQWRTLHFGSDANTGGDSADPDGDGAANLLEFIAGTDPRTNSSATFPAWRLTGGNLELSFTASVAASGFTLTAEKSPAMAAGTWSNIPNTAAPPAYKFSVPATAGGQQFVRLKASAP